MCRFSHDLRNLQAPSQAVRAAPLVRPRARPRCLCAAERHLLSLAPPRAQNLQAKKRFAPICYDFVKSQCMRGDECKYR